MVTTTTDLISQSFYLSGLVANELETVSGPQEKNGLFLLNKILAVKTANKRLIPYYTLTTTTLVVGQEKYSFPRLLEVDPNTFAINNVRFSMQAMNRRAYFGMPRVNGLQSLPFIYHFEREFAGGSLYLYPTPNSTYPMVFMGKYSLNSVVQGQDLSLTIDEFYLEYLRYALAEQICADYNLTFQPQSQQKLNEYENTIIDISPIDLTLTINSSLNGQSALNWGYVNFPGWTP